MDSAKEAFSIRISEVEDFIAFVRKLQSRGAIAKLGFAKHNECIPMLKACIFLLMYNAIESCVRLAFADIYGHVKLSNTSFSSVSPELRKIWVMQQLDAQVKPTSANRDTYLGAVESIAGLVAMSGALELNPRSLPISGNLDADQIQKLCKKHGVVLKTSAWAKGGVELETIKSKRNALAHGHISFVECGREYGLDDLSRMLRQSKHFMLGLLASVEKFTATAAYKVIV